MEALGPSRYLHGSYGGAQALLELSLDPDRFDDFLTLAAYQRLVHEHAGSEPTRSQAPSDDEAH